MWMFFLTFYFQYPNLHKSLALASFFIPSVVFWGSGLLKDTVTLACLGMATYLIYELFIRKRFKLFYAVVLVLCGYTLYVIKIYILLNFLPMAIIWIFLANLKMVRSPVAKALISPFILVVATGLSFYALVKAGEDNQKYSLEKIAETAKVTAYDIRYWTGRDAGSGYSLGDLDGSFNSMLKLAPQAINVSLFRPYIWEVKNPLMLLSALESLVLLAIVIFLIFRRNVQILQSLTNPNVLCCLVFSVTFAFAVGVSTFNFGTLVRYKIPLLPFFAVSLILINHYSKSERKFEEFDSTE